MKPRPTHLSDFVYRLAGGNEDNDLWVQRTITPDGRLAVCSVWVPTDEERARIAAGENIELVVYGGQHTPKGDTTRPVFARGGLGVVGETSGDGLDHARATAVRELRQQILKMPRAAKAQLRLGPQAEPACGVCSGLHAGNYCSHPVEDYHDVGVTDFAQMIGAEDFEQLGEAMPDEALPLIKALAGALAAERSLVVYLLAGWKP